MTEEVKQEEVQQEQQTEQPEPNAEEQLAQLKAQLQQKDQQIAEWQNTANQYYTAYNQAIQQGQTPAQAQQTAQDQTGTTQEDVDSFATVGDIKRVTENVLREQLGNIQQQYTQQQQYSQFKNQATQEIETNYEFFDKVTPKEQLIEKVHMDALIKMQQGVPAQSAYIQALTGLAAPKVLPNAAPDVPQAQGQSGYKGHVTTSPSGLDGQIAQKEQEVKELRDKFYAPGGRTDQSRKAFENASVELRNLKMQALNKL